MAAPSQGNPTGANTSGNNSQVQEEAKKGAKAVAKAIVAAVTSAFAGLKNSGPLKFSMGKIGAPLDMAGKVVSGPTKALGAIPAKMGEIFGPIAQFVEHINPNVVQQFSFAMNDLMAVVGDALQPILKAGTELVRKFADTLETMRPAIDPIIKVVVQLVGMFGKLIEPIARVMVPILGIVGQLMENVVVPAMELFIETLNMLAKATVEIINKLIDAINTLIRNTPGIPNSWQLRKMNYDDFEKKDSKGKGIRSTNRMSAEDLGAQTRAAAFGASTDWVQRGAKAAEDTAKKVGELKDAADKQAAATGWLAKMMENFFGVSQVAPNGK